MIKRVGFLVALLFLLQPAQNLAAAGTAYAHLTQDTTAVVVQVLDGDALRVQPAGSNEMVLVRLAGITTAGIREAQDFMTGALLGRTVQLMLSDAPDSHRFDMRWTPVYVTHNDIVYNRALVQRGLAFVDPNYTWHWMYSLLAGDASRAQESQLGIWEISGPHNSFVPIRWDGHRWDGHRWYGHDYWEENWDRYRYWRYYRPWEHRHDRWDYWDNRVNINTANAGQIMNILRDVRSDTGVEIVRNRERYGAFHHIEEVMDVLTRAEFDYNRGWMKVSTNINTASETELAQLIDVSYSDAREIIRFRERQPQRRFTSINQLVDEALLSSAVFERNRRFIDTRYVNQLSQRDR